MHLGSLVGEVPQIGPYYQKKLLNLDIKNVYDLLHHIPSRYLDYRTVKKIPDIRPGDILTVQGTIASITNQYTRSGKKLQIGKLVNETGSLSVVWFNQPFLVRMFSSERKVSLSGEVGWFGRRLALISPVYEILGPNGITHYTGRIVPVYPETEGLSSKWLGNRIKEALILVQDELKEFLSEKTLHTQNLLGFESAIKEVHSPQDPKSALKARKRLAFNELLFLHFKSLLRKKVWISKNKSYKITLKKVDLDAFTSQLGFTLTSSQTKVTAEILNDMGKSTPMSRLLEGDVGTGKTIVAAIAAYGAFLSGYQVAFMAPTQILAVQHFNTLNKLFNKYKVRIELLTSGRKTRSPGRCDIFVGTHALIHNNVNFEKVGFIVIDEQHRFGVEQRSHLVKKSTKFRHTPHVLTMTATPIPRTVALTLYGDLDLSLLKEYPKGRQKITTWVVPSQKRESAYEWVKKEIKENSSQIFFVCPLIEESEKGVMSQVRAVTEEYKKLKKIFKEYSVGFIHGKLSSDDKTKAIERFKRRELDILVATPVIEVGIDIPNATIMVIEGADRFGLAGLHQLRGRVGRGLKKSYCLLFSDNKSKESLSRLSALTKNYSGFELAELDLKLRGPGEIFGKSQSGFAELKIADWADINLIKNSKEVAEEILKNKEEELLLSSSFKFKNASIV